MSGSISLPPHGDTPDRDLRYICGILNNRLGYFNWYQGLAIVQRAWEAGIPLWWLRNQAKRSFTWSSWREELESWITLAEKEGGFPLP